MYTKLLLIYISQLQYMFEMPTFVLYTLIQSSIRLSKLLRIVSIIHWNLTSTDLKNGLLGAIIIMSCPIQPFHKRSFHYYLIIIQSRKWINQKGEELCNYSREKKTFNIWTNLILNRYKVSSITQI
jgi:hypothetical protein